MTKEQKLRELNRVCSQDMHEHAKSVIRWLGKKTIEQPDFSLTRRALALAIFKREDTEACGQARTACHKARAFLEDFYTTYPSPLGIQIDLPISNEDRPSGTRNKGRIWLVFRDKSFHLRSTRDPQVLMLWQKMVHALAVDRILLIYDTPDVVLTNATKDEAGQWKGTLDVSGRWAGSGEVEAGFTIAECLLLIRHPLSTHIVRWRDTKYKDIEQPRQCMIILGSSLKNKYIKRLKTRTRWKKHQAFHFVATKDSTGRGSISPRNPSKGRSPYRYKRETLQHPETDYALVSFFIDQANEQTLIAMQGISTFGTLAAVQFMCSYDGVRQLKQRLKSTDVAKSWPPSFEMILEVEIDNCAPGEISIAEIVDHGFETF